jgi:hypothetical protein
MRVISKTRKELFNKTLTDWLNNDSNLKTLNDILKEFPEWRKFAPMNIKESRYNETWQIATDENNNFIWGIDESNI